MKSSRYLWTSIGLVALIATCIFIFGFGQAIQSVLVPKTTNVILQPAIDTDLESSNEDFEILAIGDSLTKGTGDQTSFGYTRHVEEAMEQFIEEPVKLINFARNGYRTSQLLEDITSQQGIIAAVQQSNLILLTIGGNDLFSIGSEVDIDAARKKMPLAIEQVDLILSQLVHLNPDAMILYVGLYNPFLDLENANESSLFIQEWNQEIFKIVNRYPKMTLIPTYDLFEYNGLSYLSSDLYHPNQAGYQRIADRIIQVLEIDSLGGE